MNRMRRTVSTASGVLPGLLVAAVAAIVLGIVGMHALNTDAAMSDADQSAMSMSTDSHADMPQVPGGVSAAVASVTPDGGDGHDMGTMVMLCAAMLVAAGALLLVALGLRRARRVWTHAPTTGLVTARWAAVRLANGPPPAWKFSVIRC